MLIRLNVGTIFHCKYVVLAQSIEQKVNGKLYKVLSLFFPNITLSARPIRAPNFNILNHHPPTSNSPKKMANSRIARFITEVAPPQIISVMRRRTSKVLDTISEEEKECSKNEYTAASPRSLTSSNTPAAMAVGANSMYFVRNIRSFSKFSD
ncbi:unnamed protein product [Citrullus colocynthis]|uniref:Uncharacterized protein n=1 Tax=Citrullus colocynthis TaxID=252529 RepID=A0ABP0YL36_9ROSI